MVDSPSLWKVLLIGAGLFLACSATLSGVFYTGMQFQAAKTTSAQLTADAKALNSAIDANKKTAAAYEKLYQEIEANDEITPCAAPDIIKRTLDQLR